MLLWSDQAHNEQLRFHVKKPHAIQEADRQIIYFFAI